MAAHFGFKSSRAAADHLDALKRKGFLESESGKARTLRVTAPLKKLRGRVVDIPVYGSIPAGLAETREQEVEGCVSLDLETMGYRPRGSTFALRVRGDSMVGRHIMDGDHVILEQGPEPRDGQVVAALIDGESTLKTYLVKSGRPFLRAENPKYPDLIPVEELMVQGVFRALIRRAEG